VVFVVLEVLSLGSRTVVVGGLHIPATLMPWHYLQGLPLLSQSLPNRFSLLADGAAAVVLAFSLDLAWGRATGRAAPAADTPAAPAPAPAPTPAWRKAAAVALAAVALVPIIPLPLQAAAVSATPAGWQQAFARLRLASDARVLVVPLQAATVMRWQADTGVPGSVIGGYCIAPTPGTGQAELCGSGRKPTADYLKDLWLGKPGAVAPSTAQLRSDLRYWRPTAIVAVTSRDSRLGRYLSNVFGPPALQEGSLLVWRPVPVPRAIRNQKGSPVNS
jgi:hypothetical protein